MITHSSSVFVSEKEFYARKAKNLFCLFISTLCHYISVYIVKTNKRTLDEGDLKLRVHNFFNDNHWTSNYNRTFECYVCSFFLIIFLIGTTCFFRIFKKLESFHKKNGNILFRKENICWIKYKTINITKAFTKQNGCH